MTSWLIVGPPGNLEIGLARRVWGLPPGYDTAMGRIAPGDTVYFYATAPVKGVVGSGVVKGTRRDQLPIWPQEIAQGEARWPMRIEFESVQVIPRDRWGTHRVAIERGRVVLQRALQRLPDALAEKLAEGLRPGFS
ncbi:MAG: hypothetical protein HY680_09710 [Chloroflexi bacterium]|nr:hypothetical protein [Chloroflexota bacterium]